MDLSECSYSGTTAGERAPCKIVSQVVFHLLYGAYTIDHTPTDTGRACKTSRQNTGARATRGCIILTEIASS